MAQRTKVFFDGGCRPNPGMMEIAVVAGGNTHILRSIGYGSSMDAEWRALLHALRIAQTIGDYVLIGDAVAVVAQANGMVKCRGTNIAHLAAFRALVGGPDIPRVRTVKRTQNLAGIALAGLYR
jgi:ribonuclease HI